MEMRYGIETVRLCVRLWDHEHLSGPHTHVRYVIDHDFESTPEESTYKNVYKSWSANIIVIDCFLSVSWESDHTI